MFEFEAQISSDLLKLRIPNGHQPERKQFIYIKLLLAQTGPNYPALTTHTCNNVKFRNIYL